MVVVDTLHLTQCLRPGVLEWDDVAAIDRRLSALVARLLLLDADDDTVRRRTVEARAETEFIRGYSLGRFGEDEDGVVRHFLRERDRFRELFDPSALVKQRISAETPAATIIDAALTLWLEPLDVVPMMNVPGPLLR